MNTTDHARNRCRHTHNQNMNLLFCNSNRSVEALALLKKLKKCPNNVLSKKATLAFWILLMKKTKIHVLNLRTTTVKKQISSHLFANM